MVFLVVQRADICLLSNTELNAVSRCSSLPSRLEYVYFDTHPEPPAPEDARK